MMKPNKDEPFWLKGTVAVDGTNDSLLTTPKRHILVKSLTLGA